MPGAAGRMRACATHSYAMYGMALQWTCHLPWLRSTRSGRWGPVICPLLLLCSTPPASSFASVCLPSHGKRVRGHAVFFQGRLVCCCVCLKCACPPWPAHCKGLMAWALCKTFRLYGYALCKMCSLYGYSMLQQVVLDLGPHLRNTEPETCRHWT